MANPIEVGADVYFVRVEHDLNMHHAKVTAKHFLKGSAEEPEYRYELSCPTFPFVLGWAEGHEVFADKFEAAKVLDEAVMSSKEGQLERLLIERDRLDAEIEQLRMEIGVGDKRRTLSFGG